VEAACKRVRHAVEPFVKGVMAQAHWAEAVTPERGELGPQKAIASATALGRLGIPQRVLSAATLRYTLGGTTLTPRAWSKMTLHCDAPINRPWLCGWLN
jgi:hypothetical protein